MISSSEEFIQKNCLILFKCLCFLLEHWERSLKLHLHHVTLLFGHPIIKSWDVFELGHALETVLSKAPPPTTKKKKRINRDPYRLGKLRDIKSIGG